LHLRVQSLRFPLFPLFLQCVHGFEKQKHTHKAEKERAREKTSSLDSFSFNSIFLINDSVSKEVFLGVFDVAKRTTLLQSEKLHSSLPPLSLKKRERKKKRKKRKAFGCQREHPPCVKDGQRREKKQTALSSLSLAHNQNRQEKTFEFHTRVLPSSFFSCPILFLWFDQCAAKKLAQSTQTCQRFSLS